MNPRIGILIIFVFFLPGFFTGISEIEARPVYLQYSTFLGADSADYGWDIAVDDVGCAYITGFTASVDFPSVGAYQPVFGGGGLDAYITKLNTGGDDIVYSTFLGGRSEDKGYSVAVDDRAHAYLTGYTLSSDFPTFNALIKSKPGAGLKSDGFIVKLDDTGGTLIYSTFFGGSSSEQAWGIGTDWLGNAYVTGYTLSTDFPTMNAYDPTGDSYMDAFVTKIDPTGSAIIFSTYLGGRAAREYAYGLATDANGNVYISGMTESTDYPTVHAFQKVHRGVWDGFITKLNTHGTVIEFSTFLGGSGHDSANTLTIDRIGYTYAVGTTQSSDFPTLHAFQKRHGGGGYDGFLTKLDPDGKAVEYSTFLGGTARDFSYGVGHDNAGCAFVVGETESSNFHTYNAFQGVYGGGWDAFVLKMSATGMTLDWSTFLGGTGREDAKSVVADDLGDAYVTGYTESADFPTRDAMEPLHSTGGGTRDAFVTKLSTRTAVPVASLWFLYVLTAIFTCLLCIRKIT